MLKQMSFQLLAALMVGPQSKTVMRLSQLVDHIELRKN